MNEEKFEENSFLKYNFSFENSKGMNKLIPSSLSNLNNVKQEGSIDYNNAKNTPISPIINEMPLSKTTENYRLDSTFNEEDFKHNVRCKSFIFFLKDFGLSTYEFFCQNEKTLLQEKTLIDDCCECADISIKNNNFVDDSMGSDYNNLIELGKHHECPLDKWNYKIIYQNKHLLYHFYNNQL